MERYICTTCGTQFTESEYPFEQVVGAWWGAIVREDGAGVVQRSAERYAAAVGG